MATATEILDWGKRLSHARKARLMAFHRNDTVAFAKAAHDIQTVISEAMEGLQTDECHAVNIITAVWNE